MSSESHYKRMNEAFAGVARANFQERRARYAFEIFKMLLPTNLQKHTGTVQDIAGRTARHAWAAADIFIEEGKDKNGT